MRFFGEEEKKDDSAEVGELKDKIDILENENDVLEQRLDEAADAAKQKELDHKLALQEKDFELKHYESEQMKELNAKRIQLEQDLAVIQKEVQMMVKITDLNADIIDVKGLVTKLIDKLPEIKLTSLSMGNNQPAKSE